MFVSGVTKAREGKAWLRLSLVSYDSNLMEFQVRGSRLALCDHNNTNAAKISRDTVEAAVRSGSRFEEALFAVVDG